MCMREPVMEFIEKHNSTDTILKFYPEKNFGRYYKIQIRYMPNFRTIRKEDLKTLCEDVLTASRAVVALTDTAFAKNGIMELSIATMNRNYNEASIVKALEIVRRFFH